MSQPLVVSVVEEKEQICTIYHRWSAYTIASLYEIKTLMERMNAQSEEEKKKDTRIRIIHALESVYKDKEALLKSVADCSETGKAVELLNGHGGLDMDDLEFARTLFPDEEFKGDADISEGVVQISEKEMDYAMNCAQSTVTLNLDENTIRTDCLMQYADMDSFMDESCIDVEDFSESLREEGGTLQVSPFDFDELPISDIDSAIQFLKDNPVFELEDGSIVETIE